MNSKKAYRILKGQNTFVNFSNQKISIGDVFEMDKRNHRKVLNVFNFIDPTNILDKVETGPKSEFEFMSESKFSLEFSNQKNSIPILSHEANISFTRSKSIYCKVNELRHSVLPMGYMESELTKFWKDRKFNKGGRSKHLHFVSEIFEADLGIIIYSISANTSAKITTNSTAPLLNEFDFLKNEVKIESGSSQLHHFNFKEPFTPFYKSLRSYGEKGFGFI